MKISKKANWKSHIPALVHAYNSTRHETTGLTPHFVMFGRHPRLAVVDAFLGIEPDGDFRSNSQPEYVENLKKRLRFAYKVASKESKHQAKRHQKRYNLRVREVKLSPGDRILVRNVGLKGKCKLADRWSKDIFVVVSQPNPDLPIFQVRKEHGDEETKLLHRNMLLPFLGLPVQEPRSAPEVNTLSRSEERTRSEEKVIEPCPMRESRKTNSEKPDSTEFQEHSLDRYIIPARRTRNRPLRPEAPPFVPRNPNRERRKPSWMTGEWKF